MSFSGFRYKPREVKWDDQHALRREFENIASGMDAVVTHINRITEVSGNSSTGTTDTGGETGGGTATDELVKITAGDPAPGYLYNKIMAGSPNVHIWPSMAALGGEFLLVTVDQGIQTRTFEFDETTDLYLLHPFPTPYYIVSIDKPQSDGALCPIPYESVRKYPFSVRIRFGQPEFGLVSITGNLGTV